MEKGIKSEEDNLYKQSEEVADNVLDTLDKPFDKIGNRNIETKNTKYVFQMNVYPQKFDEKELDNIFNYMNKRFGTQY